MSPSKQSQLALPYADLYIVLRGLEGNLENNIADPSCRTIARSITKKRWAEGFKQVFAQQIAKNPNILQQDALGLRYGLDDGVSRTFKQVGETMPSLADLIGRTKGKDRARWLVRQAERHLRNPHRMIHIEDYIRAGQISQVKPKENLHARA